MKERVFYLFILCLACITVSAQAQQTTFTLRIDSLPCLHTYYYQTDPNETGHLTYSSDTIPDILDHSFEAIFDDQNAQRTGDTLIFRSKKFVYPNKYLTVIFDILPKHIKSIEYGEVVSDGSEQKETHYFKIDNPLLIETAFAFESSLEGTQILDHAVRDSNYKYLYVQSGNQSWTDIFDFRDSVIPASQVFFSLSKSPLLSTYSSQDTQKRTIEVFPNPTTGTLFVSIPESDLGNEVVLTDLLGKVRLSVPKGENDVLQVDVTALTSGMYWLRLGSQTQKIIVQK